MLIAYIIIETEPQIGQFLQAALLLPAGKRPKKAKKPDCVPIWWLSGHITAKKSQIWLDISQISSTFEQLQLARAAAAALLPSLSFPAKTNQQGHKAKEATSNEEAAAPACIWPSNGCCSPEIGAGKPSNRIFRGASRRISLPVL